MKRGPGRPRKDSYFKNEIDTLLAQSASKTEVNLQKEINPPQLISWGIFGNKEKESKALENFPDDDLRIWAWNINGIRPSINKNYLLKFLKESMFINFWYYRKSNNTMTEWD